MRLESAGGLLLMSAAVVAMLVANSPAAVYYDLFLDTPVEIRIGTLLIAKPLILWINDGLMAIFFFLVGLELKREVVAGELSQLNNVLLPLAGALGGIVVPIAIYVAINHGDVTAMTGWAIPTATDIAFALGVLVLFGKRVPLSLKVFLVSIAIFDDLAAITIIAVFYSGDLSLAALAVAAVCLVILTLMNRRGVVDTSPYLWVGLIMWTALLKSGVHATLAGVVLAVFIPMTAPNEPARSPLRTLENDLHHLVAFVILPIFAFANAGVTFGDMGLDDFLHPVTIGIALGLFVGKQLGVFAFCWLVLKTGLAKMPSGANLGSIYGVSILCGIGFTMSMFIGSLAFERDPNNVQIIFDERLGIIVGSLASALMAWLVLNRYLPKTPIETP